MALSSLLHHATSSSGWWGQTPFVLQLLLLSLLVGRLQDLRDKLAFAATCYVAHWKVKSLRIEKTPLILALSAVLSPLVLVVILLSVALQAPLLPLFGLPIFIVGFPRPRRFWPQPGSGYSPTVETVYYEKVAPELCRYLQRKFCSVDEDSVQTEFQNPQNGDATQTHHR